MAIHVIDAPMGAGKTSAMINYMREAPASEHFVFVTPFLTEAERINLFVVAKFCEVIFSQNPFLTS